MAENTIEENLNSPTENQSESSPAEITPIIDKETITQNQETENMEVHHHAHDPAAPHHKKNWKSYFWEFLMLFLAVFCGFLAEYQLEHKIERDREKIYMSSLYQDLKTDTLNMNILLTSTKDDIANYDTVFNIFKSNRYQKETSNAYYYGRKLVTTRNFYATDGTFTQLKNSGGLRLIRNRDIVDSIQSYMLAISTLKNLQDFHHDHFELAKSKMSKIYDANVFDIMMGDGSKPLAKPTKNYPLLPFTKAELNDYHIPMSLLKRNKLSQISMINKLQKKAIDLMNLLEEKYEFEHD